MYAVKVLNGNLLELIFFVNFAAKCITLSTKGNVLI